MSHILVKKIYQDEQFIGLCNQVSTINTDRITDPPREAWLIRKDGPIQFNIDFKDPQDGSAIKGVWLGEGGKGILIDGTLADVQAKINECCGENVTVTPVYNGVYPALFAPVAKTYTVTRVEDGSFLNQKDMLLAYSPWIINNTFARTSRNEVTKTSTYTFQSYSDPRAQAVAKNGTVVVDSVTQTALTFDSNTVAAAPGAGNHYELVVKVEGLTIGTPTPIENATSIASLVTALNANATYTAAGTYTAIGTTAVRLSSTSADHATLVIAVVPD